MENTLPKSLNYIQCLLCNYLFLNYLQIKINNKFFSDTLIRIKYYNSAYKCDYNTQ